MNIIELEELVPRQQNRKKVYDTFLKLFKSNDMIKFITNNNLPNYTEEDVIKIVLNLERGIFNSSLNQYQNNAIHFDKTWNPVFEGVYINKALSIYLNLNPNSKLQNTNLLIQFLSKKLTEFELCKLQAKDIFPEKWLENINKCGLLEKKEEIIVKEKEDVKGMFKCGRCKTYKTTYYQMQTRSAKFIGMKSILLITSWLCYWKNSYSPSKYII